MTPEIFIACSILLLVTAIFFHRKLESFGANAGKKYGTKLREKYESQPRLSDSEIVRIIESNKKHNLIYMHNIVFLKLSYYNG